MSIHASYSTCPTEVFSLSVALTVRRENMPLFPRLSTEKSIAVACGDASTYYRYFDPPGIFDPPNADILSTDSSKKAVTLVFRERIMPTTDLQDANINRFNWSLTEQRTGSPDSVVTSFELRFPDAECSTTQTKVLISKESVVCTITLERKILDLDPDDLLE